MIKILQIAVFSILVLLSGTVTYAQNDWNVGGSIVYFDDDGERNLNDSLAGVQFTAGYDWTPNFTIEALLGYSSIDGWEGGGLKVADERHFDLSLNLLAFYDRYAAFAPYALLGVGYLDVAYDGGTPPILAYKPGPSGAGATFSAGLGFKWQLGGSPYSVRAEYRARFAQDPKSLTDVLMTVGLEYAFDARTMAFDPRAGGWYLFPSIIYNDDDPDRKLDDSISGFGVNVGKDLTKIFSIEAVLGYSKIDGFYRVPPGGPFVRDSETQLDLGVHALAYYNRDAMFAPYALLGIGYNSTKFNFGGSENNPTASIGAGLKVKFGESRFSLRLEGRLRKAFDGGGRDYNDAVANLGVQYDFGARKSRTTPLGVPDSDKPRDTDGDGVLDWWDECPDTPPGVEVTAKGCEIQDMSRDADGDRVPDYRDECPDTPSGAPVDPRGCSLDSDMDGVLTGQDRCPATRYGAEVDEFGCETEPVVVNNDTDGDTILNENDRCPNTRAGARVDIYGCEIRDVISLPGVNFESASDRLLPGAENLMRDAARTLNRYPNLKVEVAGHTDNTGNPVLNMGLSDRRAKSVLDKLVEFGVDASRLSFRGYGSTQPIADNATEDGRATNRRVELRILD
jgi:OOP family OmpA-OmpF porin